jgi:hypothetical protein
MPTAERSVLVRLHDVEVQAVAEAETIVLSCSFMVCGVAAAVQGAGAHEVATTGAHTVHAERTGAAQAALTA